VSDEAAAYRTPEGLAAYWERRRKYSLRNGPPCESWSPGVHELAGRVLSGIGVCRLALDYGCGAGFFIDALLERCASVCGADLSEDALAAVNERYGANGRVSTRLVGPLGEGLEGGIGPDLVWLHSVVCHWPDDVAAAIFGELRAVASADAVWVVGDTPVLVDREFGARPGVTGAYWMYPRTLFELEDISGLRARVVYPSREVCYAVLEAE